MLVPMMGSRFMAEELIKSFQTMSPVHTTVFPFIWVSMGQRVFPVI